jgi:hypothetical protein
MAKKANPTKAYNQDDATGTVTGRNTAGESQPSAGVPAVVP